jgi:hypothetical protein
VFVASWLVAPSWQGPRYNVRAHSISDMYAAGAPGAWVLIAVFAVCGATLIGFAAWSVWPMLRPAGWPAAVGAVLLALSNYGLGDLTAAFGRLPCSQAAPGCDAEAQLAQPDGVVHSVTSAAGLLLVVVAPLFLAIAMRQAPGWERWAPGAYGFAGVFFALCVCSGLAGPIGWGGAAERVLAATGAAGIVVLAVAVRRMAPRRS